MRDYELVLILHPRLDNEQAREVVERIHRSITGRGGTITEQQAWGIRRLAYPIQHLNEGNYFLTRFRLDASRAREVEGEIRLREEVIRHLLVRLDE